MRTVGRTVVGELEMGPIQGRESTVRQDGVTLLEVLISIVLIAVMLAAASSGVVVLISSSNTANQEARANVMLTAFGDTLKALEYVECSKGSKAEVASAYNDLFDAYEDSLPVDDQLERPGKREEAQVEAVEWSSCDPGDPGTQELQIVVRSGDAERSATIVKRNPEFNDGLFAAFVDPDGPSPGDPANDANFARWTLNKPGDRFVAFDLDASLDANGGGVGSSPQARIVEYRWECGDPGNTVVLTAVPNSSSSQDVCEYAAPTSEAYIDYTIKLTVRDAQNRTDSERHSVRVFRESGQPPRPTALIKATCAGHPADQCAGGAAPLKVTFKGIATPAEGRIVEYRWNFNDPLSGGAANEVTTTTAAVEHTFQRGGTYAVTLTVVDEFGGEGEATLGVGGSSPVIVVTATGGEKPNPSFRWSPVPAAAPDAIVTFQYTGDPVTFYSWSFGDGGTSAAAAPQHTYAAAGNYIVTLTATNANGSATRSEIVQVGTYAPTSDLRATDASGCRLGFCDGYFYFAWTNGPASATDVITYQIEISHQSGICVGFNTEFRDVVAGPPGSFQTYAFRVPALSDVCINNTYRWRVRSMRQTGGQTAAWSPYSGYQSITVRRFT
jgi:prepilin-type N-terminal cleavage/methylation domain-containing protein